MPAHWKKKYRPDLIISRINRSINYSSTGISFTGFDYQEHLPVLASMIEFPTAALRQNKIALIWGAIRRTRDRLTPESFLIALNEELSKTLAQKQKMYSLITSLSIERKGFPKTIKLADCKITFHDLRLPRKFSVRNTHLSDAKIDIPPTPENYCFVQVDVTERSPETAGEKAIELLDYLRGLLAMRCNFNMEWSLDGHSSFSPINRIRTGGVHTLHLPDGTDSNGPLWYEPNFKPAKIYRFKEGAKMGKAVINDEKCISQCKYESSIRKAVTSYARSLDQRDHTTAFVKLWSALESLTTPNQAKYDDLIRRCSFIFTESDYHKQMLEHLRDFRNRSVHSESESESARTNCYLLQDYFRGAVRFYVSQRKTFSTLDEANGFLDLPADRSQLAWQLKLLKKAVKFTTPRTELSET
ncbi:hypothetical protein XSP_001058 [Xanthomonas euroxanthea]|uniref:Apea-like HEPN domain-containing protein n=1 Tax=Xanthomonas euroxanthea TaxID=2259622 RepID=A0A8E4ELI6_9XANT|nr:HEPN domain-containing protein [Xanthomonas euroxanthea]CAD1788778.1 hypothetical protein XSP_001058 [Xanthomonas euroxanthea]SYZ52260.1 hypothetical protein CPBF367_10640 [Xanthomonas arboricola pv. juglandis]